MLRSGSFQTACLSVLMPLRVILLVDLRKGSCWGFWHELSAGPRWVGSRAMVRDQKLHGVLWDVLWQVGGKYLFLSDGRYGTWTLADCYDPVDQVFG